MAGFSSNPSGADCTRNITNAVLLLLPTTATQVCVMTMCWSGGLHCVVAMRQGLFFTKLGTGQDKQIIYDIEAFAETKKDNNNNARSLEKDDSLLLDKTNKVLEHSLPGPNNVTSKYSDDSAL